MAQFPGDYKGPTLGSKPGPAPAPSVAPTYPPNVGATVIPSVLTPGAALKYSEAVLGGLLTELESNPSIATAVTIAVDGNADRVGLIFVNQGANNVFFGLNPNVSSSNGILVASSGGFLTMDVTRDFTLPSRRWWAIASGGASLVYVLELVGITYRKQG